MKNQTKARLVTYYTTRHATNDTLVVALEQTDPPTPIDYCQYYREGNAVKVRGQWVTEHQAIEDARQTFKREYDYDL